MTRFRVLVGVLTVLFLAGFVAGCGQVSDQTKQEAKKKVEAKAKQADREVKKNAEAKGQQAKQEVKKKVEADKKDLQKKVDDLKKKVEAGQDHMPIDQLDQNLQTQPAPEYFIQRGDIIYSTEFACKPRVDHCLYVDTKATDAKKLASITMQIASYPGADVFSVLFYHGLHGESRSIRVNATSYGFYEKDVAVSALRGALDEAELLGKYHGCYLTIYKGDGPDLKSW